MAYKKLLSLILFTLLPLASCRGTIEENKPTGDTGNSDNSGLQYTNTAENVSNYFEAMKKGKNGSIRYTVTDSNGDTVEEADVFTPTYYALGGSLKQGQVLLPSYDEEETQSKNLVYNFTFDDDGNVDLSNAAISISSNGQSYNYKTSFSTSDNVASYLGSRATSNSFKYDESSDMVYSTSMTLIRALAQVVQYPYAQGIQAGAKAYFSFTGDNELNFSIEGTYSDASTGDSGDVILSDAYIYDVGNSELPTNQAIDASLLNNKLTADQLSLFSARPTEFSTDFSDVTVKVNYGTSGKVKVTQSSDGQEQNIYFQENPSDSNKVYQYMQTAQDTIESTLAIEGSWSNSLYIPERAFNPNAFVLASDGLYHYIGAMPSIDYIFQSYFFFPASQLGQYGAMAGSLGVSVDPTTNKANKITTILGFYNEAGTDLLGTQRVETEVSSNAQDVTIPSEFKTTDDAVRNGLAKGLDKLKMNNDVLITSSTSNVTGTTSKITSTYYIDKTNKVLYKEQKSDDEVVFSKGWKETDKGTEKAYTPFTINADNSIKTLNLTFEGKGVTESFVNSLSTNIFKLKDGSTDTYVLKGYDLYNLASSFVFGPQGAYMIPSTLEFHTLADGTIDKVSYNYAYSTSTASGTAMVKGTETMTFTYDAAITDKPFKADFSKDLPAFVTPTTWAEQSADIDKNVQDFLKHAGGSIATQLPYLFDQNLTENWRSSYSNKMLLIAAQAPTSDDGDAFIKNYANALSSKGFSSQGTTQGIAVYQDPTGSYLVGIINQNGTVNIMAIKGSANA